MIRQHDEIPHCHVHGSVGVPGDSLILPQNHIFKTLILLRVPPEHPLDSFSRRASVCHAYLPVFIGLGKNGIQHLLQIPLRRLVGRNHDGELGHILKYGRSLLRKLLLCGLGQLIPLSIVVVIVNPLDLVLRFFDQRPKSVLLPEIIGHPDGFHIHQILYLLHLLVGDAAALCDQLLVVLYADSAPLPADHQVVLLPPLVGKLDVKAKLPIQDASKIDLAYIVPPGGHILMIQMAVVSILHVVGDLRVRRLSDGPSVQLYGIFAYSHYIYIKFHALSPVLSESAPERSAV